jgi:hypothetical protein
MAAAGVAGQDLTGLGQPGVAERLHDRQEGKTFAEPGSFVEQ